MKMNFIEKDNGLYIQTNEDICLLVSNALKQSNGNYHLLHGWYLYPQPLDLNKEYQIQILDESTCKIIKQL